MREFLGKIVSKIVRLLPLKPAKLLFSRAMVVAVVTALPTVGYATSCYETQWAYLPGSPLDRQGQSPGEVCAQLPYLYTAAYPKQTLVYLVPISWKASWFKIEALQYACKWHLENPATGNFIEPVYTVSHYYRDVTSGPGWAYGAVPKEDNCGCPAGTCCMSMGAGSGGGPAGAPGLVGGKGFGPEGAGNPILYTSLEKVERSVDWVSPVDSRFEFVRKYSSTEDVRRSYSGVSFGTSWWSQYENAVWQTGNTHLLYREMGARNEFFGSTNVVYTAKMADHPYRMERDPATAFKTSILYVKDGKGRKETYTEIINSSGTGTTDRFLKLSEISWADGYKITITRNALLQISVISDNRGQRAELSWMTQAGSSPSISVVDQILIDTAYNGTVLQPDIEIDYTYSFDPIYASALVAQSAVTKNVATSQILRTFEYGYVTGEEPLPAKLISIKDGRLDSGGLVYNYAQFTYGTQSGTTKPIATSTAHFGGTETFTGSMSLTGDVTITNPLGKTTLFDVEIIDGRKRVVSVQGAPTASCLGAAISVNYTAPSGSAKGYVC